MSENSKRLALVLISVAVTVLMVEAAVRIRQKIRFGTFSPSVLAFRMDPASGLRLPVSSGRIHINSLGFRGPELDMPKPAGRVRLAFLGASTTFCAEVSDNQHTWPHLVWNTLQRSHPAGSLDYVNGGVPGFTVSSTRLNFDRRVKQTQPDVIVIYEGINDISGDTRQLAQQQGLNIGKLDVATGPARISVAWFLIEKNLDLFKVKMAAQGRQDRLNFDPRQLSRGFETRLRDLIADAKQAAPVVVVATLSHKFRREQSPQEQIRASNSALYYMPYMSMQDLLAVY